MEERQRNTEIQNHESERCPRKGKLDQRDDVCSAS